MKKQLFFFLATIFSTMYSLAQVGEVIELQISQDCIFLLQQLLTVPRL